MMQRLPDKRRATRPGACVCALVFVVSLFLCASDARAQVDAVPGGPGRELIVNYRRAMDLIGRGDRRTGLSVLHELLTALDSADDVLLPDEEGTRQSLKARCIEQLKSASDADLEFYESQFGPEASDLLEQARRDGDQELLSEVSRKYFFTQSGQDATRELALRRLDQGDALAAAMHLSRLQRDGRPSAVDARLVALTATAWARAGLPAEADRLLNELRSTGVTEIGRGTDALELGRVGDWPDWLPGTTPGNRAAGDWTVFHGNLGRHRESASPVPIWTPLWAVDTLKTLVIESPEELAAAEAGFREMTFEITAGHRQRVRRQQSVIPAPSPLVVADRVIYRSPVTISAIRATAGEGLQAGELEWETYKPDPYVLRAFRELADGDELQTGAQAQAYAWEDLTSGTLSSDGRFVYAVEETDRVLGAFGALRQQPRAGNEWGHHPNFLRAYGIEGGSVVWQIGGDSGIRVAGMRDAVFLGPPLPFGEDLLLIVASRDEIRLLQLHVNDPLAPQPQMRVVWSQRLTRIDTENGLAPRAQLGGLSPAYASGVLVCPTGSGELVAVDPIGRGLLWRHRYAAENDPAGLRLSRRGWADSIPQIVGRHVVCAPHGADVLFCLDLLTGRELWSHDRRSGNHFVTSDNAVIVVNSGDVTAFKLTDGEPLWPAPVAISAPAGRALVHGGSMSVPLVGGRVVTIDLIHGRRLAESNSEEELGNLIAVGELIVSQTPTRLVAFAGVDSISESIRSGLAENPRDSDLLTARGVHHLQRGELQAGLTDLRDASLIDPECQATRLLVRTITGLRGDDFRRHVALLDGIGPEVRPPPPLGAGGVSGPVALLRSAFSGLEESPALRLRILQLTATEGLTDTAAAEALSQVMTIADSTSSSRFVFRPGGVVAEPRFVASRVREAIADTSEQSRQIVRKVIERELLARLEKDDLRMAVQLHSWIEPYGVDESVTEEFARRCRDAMPATAFRLFQMLRSTRDLQRNLRATVALAEMLHEQRPDLARDLADSVLARAESDAEARQVVKRWQADAQLSGLAAESAVWAGRPHVRDLQNLDIAPRPSVRSQYQTERGGWQFVREPANLIGLDSRLRTRVRVPVLAAGRAGLADSNRYVTRHRPYVVQTPTTLIVSESARELSAYDLLSPEHTRIWSGQADPASRMQTDADVLMSGYPAPVGPVAGDTLLLSRGEYLTAVSLRTGQTLWTRNLDLRFRTILADDRTIALVSTLYGGSVDLYSAFDGEFLGSRPFREARGRELCFVGRGRLLERTVETPRDEKARELAVYNFGEERPVWRHEFAAGSAVSNVTSGFVAVVEPTGDMSVVQLQTGRIVARGRTRALEKVRRAILHLSSEHFVVFTDLEREEDIQIRAFGPGYRLQNLEGRVSGVAAGLSRRSGGLIWMEAIDDEQLVLDRAFPEPTSLSPGLPVLVLVSPPRNEVQFRVLDCRTGQTIHAGRKPVRPASGWIRATPERGVIDMRIGPHGLRVEFTNDIEADAP